MAQLWGGRFTKETDQLVYNFNASISFDQKFYKQDIRGSIACYYACSIRHSYGSRTWSDHRRLKQHPYRCKNGTLEITSKYEDIHSFVEANLIDRIGDTGKKLHTGRSRNDQVALDMKLYVRDEIVEIKALVLELMNTLHSLMKEHIHTYMPGFTHLQKAQPITLAHHFGAYMEMFKRDYGRLCDIYARMNYCPLARCFSRHNLSSDRELTASFLTLQVLPLTVWILSQTAITVSNYYLHFQRLWCIWAVSQRRSLSGIQMNISLSNWMTHTAQEARSCHRKRTWYRRAGSW